MFWVFLFLALASLALSRGLYRTLLSPIGLFGVTWNGLLALFEARALDYDPLTTEAYVAFVGSFAFFACGTLIATLPYLPVRPPMPCVRVLNRRRARRALDLLNWISLFGFMLEVSDLLRLVEYPNLFSTLATRRAVAALEAGQFGGGAAGYAVASVPLAGIMGGIYVAQFRSGRIRAWTCLLVSFGSSLLTGNRSLFIWTLVLWIAAYVLTRVFANGESVRRTIRPVLLAGFVLFVVFAFVGALRIAQFSPLKDADVNVRLPWSVLHAYGYVTSGFGAFSVHVREPVRIDLPGIHTFAPIVRAVARLNSGLAGYSYDDLAQYSITRHFVSVPIRTNVFTYLAAFFDDLGWWGVFGVSLLLGCLSGFTFLKLLRRPGLGVIGFYSLFCLQCLYASALPITYFNALLVTMVGIAALDMWVSKRGRRAQSLLSAAHA